MRQDAVLRKLACLVLRLNRKTLDRPEIQYSANVSFKVRFEHGSCAVLKKHHIDRTL